jgi:hypothetical protein
MGIIKFIKNLLKFINYKFKKNSPTLVPTYWYLSTYQVGSKFQPIKLPTYQVGTNLAT